jgi:fumarylacetoacetase
LESFVASANAADTDFRSRTCRSAVSAPTTDSSWRIGVAIGDQVLDVRKAGLIDNNEMNRLIRLLPETRRALRQAISQGLRKGSRSKRSSRPRCCRRRA